MKKIVLENLNKYYNKGTKNEIHVINNTSLTFDKVGFVCLLGESGSGKTTLLNVISGIDTFHSGKIYVDGQLLKCKSHKSEPIKNNQFGYIFQNYYMINNETVYENLRLALAPYHLDAKEVEFRINYVLNETDMMRYKKRKINQLSGGQAQRIAIARALIKSPDVIFADEPTGNLDESTTLKIMTILKSISKNCLVIVATHEKRIAEFFGDRIIKIKDGKVISDHLLSNNNKVYNVVDDHNLYLKEYEENIIKNDNHQVKIYQTNLDEKIDFSIIVEHGKYYISSNQPNKFEIITPEANIQAIDDFRPVMDMNKVESSTYILESPSKNNTGVLSWKDLIHKVINNSRSKSFVIMVISLILIAAVSVLAVGDYLTIAQDKLQEQLVSDSRIVDIKIKEGNNIDAPTFNQYTLDLEQDMLKKLENSELFIAMDPYAYLLYTGFEQIENMVSNTEAVFDNFTYMPIEYLDQSSLIYGRMPESIYEVVVDQWVLENFMQNLNIISASLTKLEAFIGLKFRTDKTNIEFTIVGIAESDNMSVYASKYAIVNAAYSGLSIASLEYLKQKYPGKYDQIILSSDEIMVSSNAYRPEYTSKSIIGVTYNIYHQTFPDTLGVNTVISDEGFERIVNQIMANKKTFRIISNDKNELQNYLAEVFDSENEEYTIFRENLQYVYEDLYQKTSEEYYSLRNKKMLSRLLVTGSIFVMCIITLFITMKAHASVNMQSTMVYRLLGLKKGVVIKMYSIEILITSLIFMLPTSLIVVGILKFIAAMPASTFEFIMPFSAYGLTIVGLLIINVLVGILPVALIMRKTPAQLVSEYDL